MPSIADLLEALPNKYRTAANPLPPMVNRDASKMPFEDRDGAYFYSNFNTPLTTAEEAQYQRYLADRAMESGRDMGMDQADYDGRAYWLQSGGGVDGRGHSGDIGKKPNHPTFSNQSMYSTAQNPGGEWANSTPSGRMVPLAFANGGEGIDNPPTYFQPSAQQFDRTGNWLPGYMRKVEPDSKLSMPRALLSIADLYGLR